MGTQQVMNRRFRTQSLPLLTVSTMHFQTASQMILALMKTTLIRISHQLRPISWTTEQIHTTDFLLSSSRWILSVFSGIHKRLVLLPPSLSEGKKQVRTLSFFISFLPPFELE
jgi:hypothetical protein